MTITFADIDREMRKVANEFPNFVYLDFRKKQLMALGIPEDALKTVNCVYFDEDGERGCLFGHVLSNLGIAQYQVEEGQSIADLLRDDLDVVLTDAQADYLNDIQSTQDYRNCTWPDAIYEVDEDFEEKGINVHA